MRNTVLAILFLCSSAHPAAPPTVYACNPGRLVKPLPVPAAIARSRAPFNPVELPRAGKMLRPGETFPPLGDDEYIYLILNPSGKPGDETIFYSPRVPAEILERTRQIEKVPSHFLATHRGMVETAAEQLGIRASEVEKQVRGAGGFRCTSGYVTRLTNRSGAFPAGLTHLDYSIQVLGRRGFNPRGKRFEVVDISTRKKGDDGKPVDPLHIKEEEAARLALKNVVNSDRRFIREAMAEMHTLLLSKFPDSERPGYFDVRALWKAANAYLETVPVGQKVAAESAMAELIHYLSRTNGEGLDYAVEDLCRRFHHRCRARFVECQTVLLAASVAQRRGP